MTLSLSDLRALVSAATPGPWRVEVDESGFVTVLDGDGMFVVEAGCVGHDDPDTILIAAARTALPELLDRLEQAERDRDEARAIAEVRSWPLMSTVATEAERDSLRAQLAAKTAEAEGMRAVYEAACAVVAERRAKIQHARESTAMCRLQRAIAALSEAP